MAIVPLEKVTFIGPAAFQPGVLDDLQSLGCVHLIRLQADRGQMPEVIPNEAREALRYLQASPIRRRPTKKTDGYDRDRLIRRVLRIRRLRQALRQEADGLRQAIDDLRPWGDFRRPDVGGIGGLPLFFYVIPRRETSRIPRDIAYEVVTRDPRFDYVVAVGEPIPETHGWSPVTLAPRPLSELRQRLLAVEEEYENLLWRRVALTRWVEMLQTDLDRADDQMAKLDAARRTWADEHLFAVQGWAPKAERPRLESLAADHDLALRVETPRVADRPPTLLENPRVIASAEPCVTFFRTPGYHAWDPTPIVYVSFSLFFGMIVSDAGYGPLLLGLVGFWGIRFADTPRRRRWRRLMLTIAVAVVVYGVLVGSYFGFSPPPGSWADALRVRWDGQPMMGRQNEMMLFTVAIGVGHLVLANLISAWRQRRTARSLGHLGWAAILAGGFAFGLGSYGATEPLAMAGTVAVIVGAVAVFLFSSSRPLWTTNKREQLLRLADGLMQCGNLSKAFGDVLSYLRLFALGLASFQLAVTFNGLAADAVGRGGMGVLLGGLIFVAGHGVNLILGLMGGVVHGLRLNCIEFFNWSLTEEGYPFQPFRKKAGT